LPRKDELVSAEISRSLKLVPLPWSLNKWQFPATTHDAFWKLSSVERLAREDAFANLAPALQSVREGEFVEEAKQPPLYYLLSTAVLNGGGEFITAGPCSRHAVVFDSVGIARHSSFVCSFQAGAWRNARTVRNNPDRVNAGSADCHCARG
jgi:hypothetical protein